MVDAYGDLAAPPAADWEALLEAEPHPAVHVEDLDSVLEVMADFVDLKSPWTRGHSRKVAGGAESAAREAGLDEVGELRRAGLVHDLGGSGERHLGQTRAALGRRVGEGAPPPLPDPAHPVAVPRPGSAW